MNKNYKTLENFPEGDRQVISGLIYSYNNYIRKALDVRSVIQTLYGLDISEVVDVSGLIKPDIYQEILKYYYKSYGEKLTLGESDVDHLVSSHRLNEIKVIEDIEAKKKREAELGEILLKGEPDFGQLDTLPDLCAPKCEGRPLPQMKETTLDDFKAAFATGPKAKEFTMDTVREFGLDQKTQSDVKGPYFDPSAVEANGTQEEEAESLEDLVEALEKDPLFNTQEDDFDDLSALNEIPIPDLKPKKDESEEKKAVPKSRRVAKFNSKGEMITVYPSVAAARKANDLSKNLIYKALQDGKAVASKAKKKKEYFYKYI